MTKIAITGAGGFLGLHLRAAAQDYGIQTIGIPLGEHFDAEQARTAITGADKLIHLAGVNRGTDADVAEGNALLARQIATSLKCVDQPPATIVYANSIHAANASVYGKAKQGVADTLAAAAEQLDSEVEDVMLPNVFGEFGRPYYNSVVATFSHLIANGEQPEIQQDKELQLLHAQNAADVLLGAARAEDTQALSHWETVGGVKQLLDEFHEAYSVGEFPELSTTFRRDLFNTYRAYAFPAYAPIDITKHADQRGAFFEIVRSHGGTGQTSFSTTAPGITRGEHYHRRKIERFTVVAGEADIKLRRLFDTKVFTYRVSGEVPQSVDMPTMYTHSISNVGSETLYTTFWTNDIFDPNCPDTIAEKVI